MLLTAEQLKVLSHNVKNYLSHYQLSLRAASDRLGLSTNKIADFRDRKGGGRVNGKTKIALARGMQHKFEELVSSHINWGNRGDAPNKATRAAIREARTNATAKAAVFNIVYANGTEVGIPTGSKVVLTDDLPEGTRVLIGANRIKFESGH